MAPRPPTGPSSGAPASRPDEERKTFKRRPTDEDGDVDDFSGPPPEPLPPSALPRLTVKPRAPGVQPRDEMPEPPDDSGAPGTSGSPPGGSAPPGRDEGRRAAPAADLGDFDADAVDAPEPLMTRPVDPGEDPFTAYVGLVEQLKVHNGLSGGRVEHDTYLVAFDYEALVLAVLDSDREALQPDLDRLARIVRRAAGDDIEMRVESCPRGDRRLDPERNPFRVRAAQEARALAARRDAARRDPIVMQLVEMLDADVIDVHPN